MLSRAGGRGILVLATASLAGAVMASPAWAHAGLVTATLPGLLTGARGRAVLGEGQADDMNTVILGFVRPDLPAWFRLFIGDDGLVRRQEMRAEGHIMDHLFSELNAPIKIEAPI